MQDWAAVPIVGANNSEMRDPMVVSESATGEMISRDKLEDLDAT